MGLMIVIDLFICFFTKKSKRINFFSLNISNFFLLFFKKNKFIFKKKRKKKSDKNV